MLKPEELYEGLSKETAEAYRAQAVQKYGRAAVDKAENKLRKLSKAELEALKGEQKAVTRTLFALRSEPPDSPQVQSAIARHYEVTRKFWGTDESLDPQLEQYAGLGKALSSGRTIYHDGWKGPATVRLFLKEAMRYFAKSRGG